MKSIELSWGRVVKIWWAALWRSVIFANLFGGAVAGIAGIVMAILGHREWGASEWFLDVVTVAWLPAFMMGTRLALRARYRDFRIILVEPEP
jgi:hypothetical protein